MDVATTLAQIASLPVAERIQLVQAIWDTIAVDERALSGLTQEQKRELDRRIADLEADPTNVLTWEQIKDRVRGES